MELRVLRYFMTIAEKAASQAPQMFSMSHSQRFPGRSAIWKMNWGRSYSSVEVII